MFQRTSLYKAPIVDKVTLCIDVFRYDRDGETSIEIWRGRIELGLMNSIRQITRFPATLDGLNEALRDADVFSQAPAVRRKFKAWQAKQVQP